jgi:hypothetical protein
MKVPSATVLRTSRGIWRVDAGGEAGFDGRAVEQLRGKEAWQTGDLTGGHQLLEAEIAPRRRAPPPPTVASLGETQSSNWRKLGICDKAIAFEVYGRQGKEHLCRMANGARARSAAGLRQSASAHQARSSRLIERAD